MLAKRAAVCTFRSLPEDFEYTPGIVSVRIPVRWEMQPLCWHDAGITFCIKYNPVLMFSVHLMPDRSGIQTRKLSLESGNWIREGIRVGQRAEDKTLLPSC